MTALRHLAAIALTIILAAPTSAHDAPTGDILDLPDASLLPEDVVQVSGVVPGMGEHWANPADLPLGPIYGVSEGKIIFLEFMIDRDSLARGQSYLELASKAGIALPPIDHTDISWEPNGHEGFEVPHYDIHMYFVTHTEHEAIKP